MATGVSIPLRGLEGVPGLPGDIADSIPILSINQKLQSLIIQNE